MGLLWHRGGRFSCQVPLPGTGDRESVGKGCLAQRSQKGNRLKERLSNQAQVQAMPDLDGPFLMHKLLGPRPPPPPPLL